MNIIIIILFSLIIISIFSVAAIYYYKSICNDHNKYLPYFKLSQSQDLQDLQELPQYDV